MAMKIRRGFLGLGLSVEINWGCLAFFGVCRVLAFQDSGLHGCEDC